MEVCPKTAKVDYDAELDSIREEEYPMLKGLCNALLLSPTDRLTRMYDRHYVP